MDVGKLKSSKRKKKLYVEVSLTGRVKDIHLYHLISRKENRDVDSSMANTLLDAPKDARKRKLADANGTTCDVERLKKPKVTSGEPLADKTPNHGGEILEHGNNNISMGNSFYCHQCSKKREGAGEHNRVLLS
jgi:hypothetical protein